MSDSPKASVPNRGFNSFEMLPGEIRNQIYEHLLSSRYTEARFRRLGKASPILLCPKTLKFHLAILQTNKAINREASSFFPGDNLFVTVHFSPFPAVSRIIKSFPHIRYDNIRKFPHAALHCLVAMSTKAYSYMHRHTSEDDEFAQFYPFRNGVSIIMLADDLPNLIETLEKIRYTELRGYRTVMRLCINQAFQTRVKDSSRTRTVASTFGYFLELLQAKKVAIGPRDSVPRWDLLSDPTYRDGPHLYLWGDELNKMYNEAEL